MKIKAVLIDDEPKALELLEDKIKQQFPQIEIIARYTDSQEALADMDKHKPDLLFLDIAMPRMNGFEFLKKIEKPTFEIIFVTAFGDYALEAIKHAAIGYIMKPVITEDLIHAVNNATIHIQRKNSANLNAYLKESLGNIDEKNKKLVIPYEEGLIFSEYSDIVRLEGENGYTRIFFTDEKDILSAYNIGYYYNLLSKRVFFQCHKSHIINLNYISRYLNEGIIELGPKHQVPVSRNKKAEFLGIFNR